MGDFFAVLGTVVFFGMLGVTFFGVFLTPVFYLVIRRLTGYRKVAREVSPGVAEREPERRAAGRR